MIYVNKFIVTEMIAHSKVLIRAKFREWVKFLCEYCDRFADALTYVVLIPCIFPEGLHHVATR